MGNPALLTVNGTGSAIWTPDWSQNPFVVSIGICGNSSGVNGTAAVDFSLFDMASVDVNGLSTATVATAWVNTVAAAGFTSQMVVSNFTTPCQALRVNVMTATATSSFSVMFVQATYGR